MEIVHRPLLNVNKVIELYAKEDGVPITYVCSSALDGSEYSMDIFYRSTPHSTFGNRYFGLYYSNEEFPSLYIANADKIEDLSFDMIEINDKLHYSKHRHDFNQVGSVAIDGGRAYTRLIGNAKVKVIIMKVKDGEFVIG